MKKVISILSVIAMVLSILAIPLLDLPAGKLPGTGKVYAAENLTGTAYAVFNSGTGELDFIRSTENHKNGDTGTVKSISGGSYTGTIYAGFEENTANYKSDISRFNKHPTPWFDVLDKIKTVKFIDNIKPATTSSWFAGMTHCTSMDLSNLLTNKVTDMSNMFGGDGSSSDGDFGGYDLDGCSSLESINLSSFDTSSVTNMSGMFENCSRLKYLDLSNLDTSNVTNISLFLYNCESLSKVTFGN